eukprot:5070356-Alexandrium_andersonii.AAC.1
MCIRDSSHTVPTGPSSNPTPETPNPGTCNHRGNRTWNDSREASASEAPAPPPAHGFARDSQWAGEVWQ